MENLLPCPFCGGEAEILNYDPNKDIGYREPYTAQCSKECCCLGRDFRTREEAAEAWNRRVQPQQPDVVHGQWIKKQNPQWPAYEHDACSICGWWNTKNSMCYESTKKPGHSLNHCPNCGAKMDGGEKDATD